MNDRRRRRPGRRQPGSNQRTDEGQIDGKAGEVWHLPNDPPHPHHPPARRGHLPPRRPAPDQAPQHPSAAAARLGVVNPTVRELLELQYEFQEPFVVDSSKIAAKLDVHATPVEQALADTVASYRPTTN